MNLARIVRIVFYLGLLAYFSSKVAQSAIKLTSRQAIKCTCRIYTWAIIKHITLFLGWHVKCSGVT